MNLEVVAAVFLDLVRKPCSQSFSQRDPQKFASVLGEPGKNAKSDLLSLSSEWGL